VSRKELRELEAVLERDYVRSEHADRILARKRALAEAQEALRQAKAKTRTRRRRR
jgi:hypothetical protein